jgi:hypothetical protein
MGPVQVGGLGAAGPPGRYYHLVAVAPAEAMARLRASLCL